MEEQKILLGWKLDTRSLAVSLPFDKFKAWGDGIMRMMEKGKTSFSELETLIGRLGHVSVVIQHSKHFMSRLRYLMNRAKHRRIIPIDQESKEDLNFHLKILKKAHLGISMNLLTFREPTIAYRSDACPAGMGGYSNNGRSWRFQIPQHLQFRATINMLEHLASTIRPWIDILEGSAVYCHSQTALPRLVG